MRPAAPSSLTNTTRRAAMIGSASVAALALSNQRGLAADGAADDITFPFANGKRHFVPAGTFPQKGDMILQRTRAPLLETPWSVFQQHLFTPNDQAYVRWHMADFPTSIDAGTYRIKVSGKVKKPFELSLEDLVKAFPPKRMAAINQCSGNSRGYINPRVAGAQWSNGAMYNAMWTGVPLSHLLARAGIDPSATHVAFRSLEQGGGLYPPNVTFEKVLPIKRANDGEVMIAYQMNGADMPLLNGYPVRLIVPGWYSTYWVKMLTEIEVIDHPGTGFWMAVAYKIPDTPTGEMTPGQKDVKMVPINKMKPRSFFTSLENGATIPRGKTITLAGFAFGGGSALKTVQVSLNGGKTWRTAMLGKNYGAYGFRQWHTKLSLAKPGSYRLMVKAANVAGHVQPPVAGWNPGGFMYNAIEHIDVTVA
jgi:DMSO/TMAO reductase YedYZ molybdopterin-dependent catalytic subunit